MLRSFKLKRYIASDLVEEGSFSSNRKYTLIPPPRIGKQREPAQGDELE
jgi:hypothetical protein